MQGFLSSLPEFKKPQSLVPQCGVCGLWKNCHSPKMKPYGEGKKKILIVGEAPGKNEDNEGRQFIGKAGQLLRSTLSKFEIDMDKDCWVTNSLICHPKHPDGTNRTPKEKEIGYCRPNLIRTIKELQPQVIILLGACAVKSLIGWLWKEHVGSISRWDGWQIPSQRINAWVCPTWHPSYILRTDYGMSERENPVRRLFFERHLEAACKLDKRPWEKVPNWEKEVRVILDTEEATGFIQSMVQSRRPIAFDYETNMLKPDSDKARIISCSVSDGISSIAFPWHGKVKKAVRSMLWDRRIPKIATNLKFEERWTRKEFGHGVKNWGFDTMLAAHVLNNRKTVCSIKFQGFVLLGIDVWNEGIDFGSVGSNEENNLRNVDLQRLLKYNAMDALVEWKVAEIQANKLGVFFNG